MAVTRTGVTQNNGKVRNDAPGGRLYKAGEGLRTGKVHESNAVRD